ncbi:MAG: hypothetical protein IPI04_09005 [Ignavibacteria bacterium]|nr:hypothetical protein [Ignavibacteria bacterium]
MHSIIKCRHIHLLFFMVVEWFLFAFVLFHALNGIRIVIVDWADGKVS